jgi:threonine synthase
MFYSTRNQKIRIPFSEALLRGLSLEGGLFLPTKIPTLNIDETLLPLSYKEIAYRVLAPYIDDFSSLEIKTAINNAYDERHFPKSIIEVKNYEGFSFMELFHGETLTFKDMALSLLPYLMKIASSKHPEAKPIKILTATSGDTGSAVLSAFSMMKDISISVLYPDKGIAPIQEKQMLYFTSSTSRAYALKDSNFDTCQSLVKNLLVAGNKDGFTSANSINIGRLLPQIVYYYFTYIELVNNHVISLGDKVDFIVPTGNFGDIFAGYLAKRMRLPVNRLIIASNENRVLVDFFKTGIYDLNREFIKTNSPSMDILISSNLERLLSLVIEDDETIRYLMNELKTKKRFSVEGEILQKLQETFLAYSASQEETKEAIKSCYSNYHYILDPHSAVAFHAYKEYAKVYSKNHVVLVLTASPLKFPTTICQALGFSYKDYIDALHVLIQNTQLPLPDALKKVLACQTPKFLLSPRQVKHEVFKEHTYEVKAPATSANLGPGFDVMGLSLSLFNSFSFTKNEKMETKGFPDLKGKDNLVLSSYEYVFKKLGMEVVPALIEEKQNSIPLSRGLGSSASCIIAGILGANAILKNKLSLIEEYKMAIEIEGHPDNVAPCLFGGLIANIKGNDGYHPYKLKVSSKLRFLLIIPSYCVSTEKARSILPSTYPLESITSNISHMALLPLALEKGNIPLLKEALSDLIHVPYRKKLIKEYEEIENIVAEQCGLPFTISGSGSTMIAFYLVDDEIKVHTLIEELEKKIPKSGMSYKLVTLNSKPTKTKEIKSYE